MDTIFATATARGRAGLGVIRVSGPAAHALCHALTGGVPPFRQAALRNLRWREELLDQALVIAFAENHSFTGEAVVEFHVHGGPAVIAAVLRAVSDTGLCRLAEPGEFTRRALDNGKLDLTQVEGLADLIDAETEAQRRQALRVLSGDIGRRVDSWRARLIRAAALLEATIDFVEEDVPVDVRPEVQELLAALASEFAAEIAAGRQAERVRDGFEVAILGLPNAGKSTLLNRLAGREAAITSDIAGTTRDVIEVRMDINGLPVTLLDTAGLRDATDDIEREGIRRAVARAENADLRLFLGPAPGVGMRKDDILVHPKCDLGPGPGLPVSARTGDGIDALLAEVSARLSARVAGQSLLVRERQRLALQQGLAGVQSVLDRIAAPYYLPEIAAEDLRVALRALDALVGRVDVDELLGEIFQSFCIGK